MNHGKEYHDLLNAMSTPGGVPADRIRAAEEELGITFPLPYRHFLAQYGACMATGFEVAGLFEEPEGDDSPMWIDIVLATKQARRASRGRLPNSLIPISDNGQDVSFYLDTESEQGRVLGYGPGAEGQAVAESFVNFVVKLAKGGLCH